MPLPLLFLLSDLLFFFIFYIVGYRKKVVIDNLRNSFPDKKPEEIKTIARLFYRHFCDLTVETIKLSGFNEKEFRKRMIVKNGELIDHFFEQGKSVVVLTMHYNNWEWGSVFPLYLKHRILGIYKPLHNEYFDAFLNLTRARYGAEMVPNALVLKRVIRAQRENEPVFIWLAGDQTPPYFHKFWMLFLNQETMFYPGPAAISRKFNLPVIFQKTEKKDRGVYEVSFEVLFDNPAEYSEKEIMKAYIEKMEESIRERPEFYLWSHKRWKNKRPEDVLLSE